MAVATLNLRNSLPRELQLEIESLGVAALKSPRRRTTKRKTKRRTSQKASLAHMPSELLEQIFLELDPRSVNAVTSVNKRFTCIGTSRFWKRLLSIYWSSQMEFDEPVSARLALSKTLPAPQIHFVSHHHFALGIQEVATHAAWLGQSALMPFSGSVYLGLTLPHMPVRNSLARFYPDRQFYLAAYGAEDTNFKFTALVLSAPKINRDTKHTRRSSRDKNTHIIPRHFFPIGLVSCTDQLAFLENFKGALAQGTPNAMLLAQAISSLFMSVHTHASLGRLSIRIPGLTSLPPPKEVDKFYVRCTILIARIPSLAMEFKFEDGFLCDLRMQDPSAPWEFM